MSLNCASSRCAPAQAPHALLTEYYANEQQRQACLRRIFDDTAIDYELIENLLALGSGPWHRCQALQRAGLVNDMRVLDVGIGTSLVAALVTGVDPSAGMMAAGKLPEAVTHVEGWAACLPLPDDDFDFPSMGCALQHISDLRMAFAEFNCVFQPGSRLCLLEITQAQSRAGKWVFKTYMHDMIALITRMVLRQKDTATIWRYYWDSIEACVPPEQVMATLSAANLTQVTRHVEPGIFSGYQTRKALPDAPFITIKE